MTHDQSLLWQDLGDGICHLILNRPPVNALTPELLQDVSEGLDRLAEDPTVRAVVISSQFKVFSAGMDLKEAQHFGPKEQQAIINGLNVTFPKLYAFPKPTIVVSTGAAIAGGLFFVLAGDYRIAGPRAKFGLAEVRVGVDFPVGPLEIARDALMPATLRRLMLGGKPINADAALAAGIVDTIKEDGEIMDFARTIALDYANIPPKAFAAVKMQIRRPAIEVINAAMRSDINNPTDNWYSEETAPAMAAMIG